MARWGAPTMTGMGSGLLVSVLDIKGVNGFLFILAIGFLVLASRIDFDAEE